MTEIIFKIKITLNCFLIDTFLYKISLYFIRYFQHLVLDTEITSSRIKYKEAETIKQLYKNHNADFKSFKSVKEKVKAK